jgi:hypothetical protein
MPRLQLRRQPSPNNPPAVADSGFSPQMVLRAEPLLHPPPRTRHSWTLRRTHCVRRLRNSLLMSDQPLPRDAPTTGENDLPDRRQVARYSCHQRARVRFIARPSFRPYRAVLRDISTNGIGLVLDHRLEPGTVMAIQLRSKFTGLSGILSAKCTHCTPLPNGTWLLGCTLSRSLTVDEVRTLQEDTTAVDLFQR